MNVQSLKKEAAAILVSILFLVLGFLAVWITKDVVGVSGDALFVAVLFVPIIVYMILTGRLRELRAGALQAKFADLAEKPIERITQTTDASVRDIETSVQDMVLVEKGLLEELKMAIRQIDESKPIALTLVMGTKDFYKPKVLKDYLRIISQYRTFKFMVILDQENQFVAYLPAWTAQQILEIEALGAEFVKAINNGQVRKLQRYPGLVTKTISIKVTHKQALQEMTDRNLEALVVIDENKRLRGVVELEQVLSQLMLALTGS
jgi:signal-transduction protein with cAMP-binding, CBS, and nucleotidyltransferase domain